MKSLLSIFFALSITLASTGTSFAPQASSTTIYSDPSVMVYGPLDSYAPPSSAAWGAPAPAVETFKVSVWPTLDPAIWISNTFQTEGNIQGDTWRRFNRPVPLCNGATNISGVINVTADNAEEVYVNGTLVGSDGEVQGPFVDNFEWSTIIRYPFQVAAADTLTFDFIVRNYAVPGVGNPTGLIFNISISYDCPTTATPTDTPTSTPTNLPGVCSTSIFSDPSVMVSGPLDSYAPPSSAAWGAPVPAVATFRPLVWPELVGGSAIWISNTFQTEGNIQGDTWRHFTRTVQLGTGASNISGTITATADNAEEVYVNGTLVGSDGEVQGPFVDNFEWSTIIRYPFQVAAADTLTFDFIVRNYAVPGVGNPTGLIFNISVTYNCPSTSTPTNTPSGTPNTPTNTPQLAQLKLCIDTASGVPQGTPFAFQVNAASYTVQAGYCILAGTYPLNTNVTIQETIPPGYYVGDIEVLPSGRLVSRDMSIGKVVARIGTGVTEVIYTNRVATTPTPTDDATSTPTPTRTPTSIPSCSPNCTPTPTPTPTGRMQICKEADGAGVTGNFTFRYNSRSKTVPVGSCTLIFSMSIGTVTITEDARAGYAVSDIYTIPAGRLVSKDLDNRTATVTIVEGNASTQTIVVFVNRTVTITTNQTSPDDASMTFYLYDMQNGAGLVWHDPLEAVLSTNHKLPFPGISPVD